jgi:oligopeptidase B
MRHFGLRRYAGPLALVVLGACTTAVIPRSPAEPAGVEPPLAQQRPFTVTTPHGASRVDEFYWLRERENPEVIAYLEAENAYTQAVMAPTEELQERIFQEIRGRSRETDESVPYRIRNHWYYTRTEEGKAHPIFVRRRGSLDAPEQILLDANERAAGKPYYDAAMSISSGEDILAFAEDTVGRNIVTIRFRNLRTGELLPDVISDVSWHMSWAEDNRTLFYAAKDPVTLRNDRIFRYTLGGGPGSEQLVFTETDERFSTSVSKSKSREYMVIRSSQTLSQEYRTLRADQPHGEFQLLVPRERGHEHSIFHVGDHFYIRTNDGARNFRLMRTPVGRTAREHWEEVIAHRPGVFLQDVEVFRDHLVVTEQRDALTHLQIRPLGGGEPHYVSFGEEVYMVSPAENVEMDTHVLRFSYQSLTTPNSTYDYDMRTRERTLLKRTEVLGGYDPAEYHSERFFTTARDGTNVPVSLVYRRDLRASGPQPLLLYGYGSYGLSTNPSFSSIRLSLLDRGFVYAIAHVRGGQEMGREWYESGRQMEKMNTFTDFIDVAEHLIARGFTTPSRLYATGGSAGGLLMGAVMNLRPDLFHGIVTQVPFVDVVTTMLDETIPLTTFEWDEWGDPRQPEAYEYMLSYSPYDNVTRRAYPNLLVTTGLHDSQVQYWEPAKWIARLRVNNTGPSRILLLTNMTAGHSGAAGRYQRWREIALEYAFLLQLAGLTDRQPVGPSAGIAGESSVTFSTQFPSYGPGAEVVLRLHNATAGDLGYNLCNSGLQRLEGGEWTSVPEDRVCTMELRVMQPGLDATYTLRLPPALPAGQYRYVTTVEHMQSGERPSVHTNTFAVTPRG